MGNLLQDRDWQADLARLVRENSPDGLLDPLGAVGGKLRALARIEPVYRLHEADVALVNEVEQRHAEVLVITRDLHYQAEVRRDHLFACGPVAAPDPFGQR